MPSLVTLAAVLQLIRIFTQAERHPGDMVEFTSEGQIKKSHNLKVSMPHTHEESKLQVSSNETKGIYTFVKSGNPHKRGQEDGQRFATTRATQGPSTKLYRQCPATYNSRLQQNQAAFKFMEYCLKEIDNPGKELSGKQKGSIQDCTGRMTNTGEITPFGGTIVSHKANASSKDFRMNWKKHDEGGVCHAKAYKVHCENGEFVHKQCKAQHLYRAYQNGRGWYGNYWVAMHPTQFPHKKKGFREQTAICQDWTSLDNYVKVELNAAHACNSIYWIGNGERVHNCGNPIETYDFSATLQIVSCTYNPHSVTKIHSAPFTE